MIILQSDLSIRGHAILEGNMRPYCRAIRHFLDCHGNYKLSCPPNLSHNIINLLVHSFWVGQYGGIFSSQVMYCPSLRSGQYCHPRTEYSLVLPSQSCNNIIMFIAGRQAGKTQIYSVYYSSKMNILVERIWENEKFL